MARDSGLLVLHRRGHKRNNREQAAQKWFCDGCKKEHKIATIRFITTDNRNLCMQRFSKESK